MMMEEWTRETTGGPDGPRDAYGRQPKGTITEGVRARVWPSQMKHTDPPENVTTTTSTALVLGALGMEIGDLLIAPNGDTYRVTGFDEIRLGRLTHYETQLLRVSGVV